ncbi:hypothetical protein Syun_025322 [Stephania yunnanensis]|uniref:Uncharacterized protein n=1 Tax=Stephania yunnanensis TaxID=152371 RepID=A0AAP0HUS8_9MAGN
MAEAVAKDRDRVRVPVKCRDNDKCLVGHKYRDMDNRFHQDKDFNVLVWECGHLGHFTSTCSQQQAGITEPGAESCCCRARSRRSPARHGGAQLVAEEPSPTK